MLLEQLRKCMKSILSDKRYQHSIGVEEVCYDLALLHGEDTMKASISGILHDCAKYMTDKELMLECEKYNMPISEVERKLPSLLHCKLGALYARERYGIEDEYILDAITYHTTGRPAMTKLEKILFIADYIEPNRKNISNIDYIREVAYDNLNKALLIILRQTLDYLNENKNIISPKTKETYDYYVNQ